MIATLEGHDNEVKCTAFDSSGSLLATCSRDKSVWIWEMESNKDFECVSVCTGHQQDVKAVKWHPNKELLASASYDDTIKLWTSSDDDWHCTDTLSGHSSTVWDVCWSPDGDQLASCSDDRTTKIWKLENRSWQTHQTLKNCNRRAIFSVDWSQNGVLATGGGDNALNIFTKDSDGQFKLTTTKTQAHTSDINSVSWNYKYPNILATGGDDGVIHIWSFTC